VQRNGIVIDHVQYWGAELRRLVGSKVLVKRTFADQNRAMIFDIEGRFLCYAEADYFAESGDLAADNDRVNGARKLLMDDIKEFGKTIPKLPEGKRGAIDFAQAHRGLYAEPAEPEGLVISQVANGAYELPAPESKPHIRLVKEAEPKTRLKSSLDESLE